MSHQRPFRKFDIMLMQMSEITKKTGELKQHGKFVKTILFLQLIKRADKTLKFFQYSLESFPMFQVLLFKYQVEYTKPLLFFF